jgi:Transposase domain (DUF772)
MSTKRSQIRILCAEPKRISTSRFSEFRVNYSGTDLPEIANTLGNSLFHQAAHSRLTRPRRRILPRSRCFFRSRPLQTPALLLGGDDSLHALSADPPFLPRLLILKHVRDWSYQVSEREVRANLVYRKFARIGAEKVPDAKTLGRPALRKTHPLANRLKPEDVGNKSSCPVLIISDLSGL